jgi:hypothetical protein
MEVLSVALSHVRLLKAEVEVVGSHQRTEEVEEAAAVVGGHILAEAVVAGYPSSL